MELLGKSLEDLFQESKKHFSLHTVCMIGIQMLERIEFIHNKHIIHRDIKPDNFVMGLGSKDTTVYILDFGLAKKYRSSRTLQHIKFNINRKLTGTARYASINALRGCEQSRRDDLEAIGYVLMYFLRGSLPWQGLRVDRRDDRYKKIYEKKKATTPEDLCYGHPNEFAEYVKYTRNLDFEQNPDYTYLKGLFDSVMKAKNYVNDFKFDWLRDKGGNVPSLEANNEQKNQHNKNNQPYGNKQQQQDENENNINFNPNTNPQMNKHLMTHVGVDNELMKSHTKQYNERLGTHFANYNTHVEVTDIHNDDANNNNNNNNNNKDRKGNDQDNQLARKGTDISPNVSGVNENKRSGSKEKKKKSKGCIVY